MTKLFSSLKISSSLTLKNRLAKGAMSENLASSSDKLPSHLHNKLYERWAKGGLGLSMTGNVMVDSLHLGEPGNVVIEGESKLLKERLKNWAQSATINDTACFVQLNHPGKQSPNLLTKTPLAPSAIPLHPSMRKLFNPPRAMSEEEILDVIKRFSHAAKLCYEANFSGVQIHGAHGYLVSQFLSPLHNQRHDKWGGSAEKRMRFVMELYRSMRQHTHKDFPISIKLNSADFQKGGFSEEESMEVMKALSQEGINFIEISGGSYEAPVMMNPNEKIKESTKKREAYFLSFAEKIRNHLPTTPLMVTGGFRTKSVMEEALQSGCLDLIGLGRPLAIDPDFPKKLEENKVKTISVPPIRTNIKAIDKTAMLEISWYALQMRRMAQGKETIPQMSALSAFIKSTLLYGGQLFRRARSN